MNKKKGFLPYIVAFLLFVVIPALYFLPQYEGKGFRQFDNVQANGAVDPIVQHIEKYGENPHWVANMFGGMPSYPIYMDSAPNAIKSSASILFFLGDPASYYFVLMAGFFVMLICFRVNPWLAIIGSLAYGLSTYFIIIFEAGHIMKIVALCYVAPMIGALYYTYRRSFLVGAPLFGIFTLLEISSVHPQITYYFILVLLIMVLSFAVLSYKQKEIKKFLIASGALVATTLLAVSANLMYLYYTYDYSKDSTRGKMILTSEAIDERQNSGGLDSEYITAWSYGKMESFNLFIPNLTGGKSNGGFSEDGEVSETLQKFTDKRASQSIVKQLPGYWGPQPMTSGPVYLGAVMIFLFVLGLFIVRGVNLWWIVGATLLSLLLAWGKNFMGLTDLFINYFPLYDKFRTVSMILVVIELTVPLMAMLALAKIWNGEVDPLKLKKALWRTLYITGGVAFFFLLMGGAVLSFTSPTDGQLGLPNEIIEAMRQERISMMRLDALRSLFFVLFTFGAIWLLLKYKLNRKLFITVMIVLVLADMVPVALRHVNYEMFSEQKEVANKNILTDVDREILKDPAINYRVANFAVSTFSDATTSTHHRSVGGYFAAKPRRYQDLIDYHLSKMNTSVYNMLNTKYFIVADEKGTQSVRMNPDAYGNAWVVSDVKMVATPNEEIAALNGTDLSKVAVVSNEFSDLIKNVNFSAVIPDSIAVTGDSTGVKDTIIQTQYKANQMIYKSSLAADRLVLFSEIYYPKGWKAFIDNVEVPYLRANYVLNALVVPAGEHTIAFEFEPPHFSMIRSIAGVSSALLLLLLILGVVVNALKNKNKNKNVS